MLAWLRRIRHPLGAAFGVLAFFIGVLGLSVPGWRSWFLAHPLMGWVLALTLLAVTVFVYVLLDQEVVRVVADRESRVTQSQMAVDECRAELGALGEKLLAAQAGPSAHDRRLMELWRDEFPDDGNWRYDVRFFNPKWFTSELTTPMHKLAHGVWSDRHFTDTALEGAFRKVVEAAREFQKANGAVSEHVKYAGDPPIAFYTIMHFSEQAGGEPRYRKELARSGDLALAVTEAIDNFEVVAAKHGI